MPLFKFKVSDSTGAISELMIEGDSQTDATRRIQRRGLMPISFLGEGASASQGGTKSKFRVVEFTDRLVPLLEADISLDRSLGILADDQENPAMGNLASELRRGLHEGRKLSDLIRERGRMFPPIYSGIVEAGEEAGALPKVMGQLRQFLMDAEELKSFIVSAAVYPAFIAVAGVIMLVFILGVIVPKFARSMAGAGIQSTATDLLLGLSSALHSYWWVALVLVAGIVVLVVQIRKPDSAVSRAWDAWILKVPLIGKLVLFSNIARLCRTMAILMRSGVHLLDTVSIANRVVQNSTIRSSIQGLAGDLRQGQRLSAGLSQSRYIPPLMLKMISVGEETGAVDSMLDRVADRYEADMKRSIKRMLSFFEPIVIIVLGLCVGCIVVLMFMAIMDMQNIAR
ncbi:MAG: type II secretion system F family protein [Victivallales bacterium]|nr:type II secretion system F family protein [Victivallales bacterium]